MILSTGAKLHMAGSKVRCIDDTGKNYTLEEGINDIPTNIIQYYQHSQQVYNHNNNNNVMFVCLFVYSVLRSVVM